MLRIGADASDCLRREFPARHEPVPLHDPSKWPVGGACDPDSGGDLHSVVGNTLALADEKRFALKALRAHRARDAQGCAEFAGTVRKVDTALDPGTPLVHQADSIQRL